MQLALSAAASDLVMPDVQQICGSAAGCARRRWRRRWGCHCEPHLFAGNLSHLLARDAHLRLGSNTSTSPARAREPLRLHQGQRSPVDEAGQRPGLERGRREALSGLTPRAHAPRAGAAQVASTASRNTCATGPTPARAAVEGSRSRLRHSSGVDFVSLLAGRDVDVDSARSAPAPATSHRALVSSRTYSAVAPWWRADQAAG